MTLGGGIGTLARRYGLTIDNLLGVDMVLADGCFVTADKEHNADLFWAVRGGDGNFGIVTSFLFRGNSVSTVYGGPMFWPIEESGDILPYWQDLILKAPDELNGWFGFGTIPPVEPFPEHYHMKKMCSIHIYPINGSTGRVGPHETPWGYRDANFSQVIVAVDPDPANNEHMIKWAKDAWAALHPYSAGGAYLNFKMDEGIETVRAGYGDNYKRLAQIKAKYDPNNFFHINQNILPRP